MTPRACLEMALAAEIKAERFFRDTLATTTDTELQGLLGELADEEVEHQRMVREQLARLPADDRVAREDVADEPVGQD